MHDLVIEANVEIPASVKRDYLLLDLANPISEFDILGIKFYIDGIEESS